MKAITLTQPWATLIAIGAKRIETRGWPTRYRGPLLIHAAKGLQPIGGPEGLLALCRQPPFSEVLRDRYQGKTYGEALPFGAAIATGDLVDCVPTAELTDLTDRERAFGDYSPGRYGFLLADVVPFPEPLYCRGALGLWIPPDHVTAYAAGALDAEQACLCCMCGTVTLERDWTYWQRADDEEDGGTGDEWRPSRPGEGDPMMRCPACKWEHQDTDDGSGVYQGTLPQMTAQREADLPEMAEWWAERLREVATA